jgi:hypothetical protein
MQYWVFFIGGVGGDGFSNLLEHANNITPADGNLCWRFRKLAHTEKIAFKPALHLTHPFLRFKDATLDLSTVRPTNHYVDLVDKGIDTVVSVHPWYYNFDPAFKHWDLFEKDQHKIWLYSADKKRIIADFVDKNPNTQTKLHQQLNKLLSDTDPPLYWAPDLKYNTYIDIDRAWQDWQYLNNILFDIGIDLDKKYYDEYLHVAKKYVNCVDTSI